MSGTILVIVVVAVMATAALWGAAWGKPLQPCTSGIGAANTRDGTKTIIWYPKGCVHP